jgi:hypothetical protein
MHLIGRKGHKSEAYPRGAAGSPGAAQPFAQLGLSANVPYVDGNTSGIPFDTVVYRSASFGDFEQEGGISVFFVPFGVYLVTLQVVIDNTPTTLGVSLQVGSGSATDVSASDIEGQQAVNATISAVRAGSETPSPGHILPCAVVPLISVVGGGDGNILAATTKLFVWKLTEFQPVAP